MKTLGLVMMMTLGLQGLSAQTLNDMEEYVDTKNALFSGVITKMQDGIKTDFTVVNGVVTGPANYYYADGKLMESGTFTKGQKDQKWVRYSENGTVSAIAFYSLGRKTGTWLVFDDNTKKRFEMNYDNGEKTGVWTSWDENGVVMNTKNYGQAN